MKNSDNGSMHLAWASKQMALSSLHRTVTDLFDNAVRLSVTDYEDMERNKRKDSEKDGPTKEW